MGWALSPPLCGQAPSIDPRHAYNKSGHSQSRQTSTRTRYIKLAVEWRLEAPIFACYTEIASHLASLDFLGGVDVAWWKANLDLVGAVAVMAFVGPAQAQTTWYVDDNASLAGDGTSWSTAFKYLQDALVVAASGDEIHTAVGSYKPDRDEAGNVIPGERTETFQLITGVALYGGYRGCPGGDCHSGDPDERDVDLYEVILSGDLLGNDGPGFANDDENSYHVVTGSGTDTTAILHGFTIAGGNANAPEPNDRGGGMFNESGSPTLIDCIFTHNRAAGSVTDNDARGGGMYNAGSSPALMGCVFRTNRADGGPYSSGLGGGIYNRDSHPTLTNCTFQENQADGGWEGGLGAGGGIFNYDNSQPMLINCTFTGNRGGSYGGGLCSSQSSPTLINCLFNGNTTMAWADWDYGGGMYHGGVGTPVLTNCTFFDNYADSGGGLYSGCDAQTTVTNCIFWHNTDRNGMLESSQISVDLLDMNYTCVEGLTGGLGGTGNIGDDPLFVDPDGGDDIPGTDDDDLRLASTSPCIDRGENGAVPPSVTTDLAGDPRIAGDSVDIGAYEFQPAPIPIVSEWGMVVMTLLVLAAGTVVLRRRVVACN